MNIIIFNIIDITSTHTVPCNDIILTTRFPFFFFYGNSDFPLMISTEVENRVHKNLTLNEFIKLNSFAVNTVNVEVFCVLRVKEL